MRINGIINKAVDYLKTVIENREGSFSEFDLPVTIKSSRYTKEMIGARRKTSPNNIFSKMRAMSGSSNPYYDAEVFVRQGEFMASFTDDCETATPLYSYYTTYAQMNNAQLRTYFTWRTKVRRGQIENTSLSYAFCYICELLNNIGVTNADDGIEKLLSFWVGFRVFNARIDAYLIEWVRDYYVVNCPTSSFDLIMSRSPIQYRSKCELLDKLYLGIWDINLVEMYSRHRTTKKSFYKLGNRMIIEDCLNAVLISLNALFKEKGLDLVDLYVSVSKSCNYAPFRGAVYVHGKYRNKTVKLNDYEEYSCKNGNWSVSEHKYTNYQAIKGYILKTIEIEMRKALGGKPRLSPPKDDEIGIELRDGKRSWNQVDEWRKKAYELLKSTEFTQTILNAVQDYCKTSNLIFKDGSITKIEPVKIDLSKLDRIREEYEATAKKLIIEEYIQEGTAVPPSNLEQVATLEQMGVSPGFVGFVGLLSCEEKTLLGTVLRSKRAPLNNELLVDAINKKSLAAINDNIIAYIDGFPCVYDEYENELMLLLGANL